jgi:CHAD domain-containing protein
MTAAAPFSGANEPGSHGPELAPRLPGNSVQGLARSLKKQWKRYRKGLKRCQDNLSEKAIHAFRVETRRLLSTAELLGGFLPARRVEKVQRLLKRHLDVFGDLRDTQVQLAAVRGMLRAFPAARPFRDRLREREERFARRTRKNVKKVRTGRLAKLIAGCRGEVERQLAGAAPEKARALLLRSVDRAFRRTRQLRTRIDARDTLTIHRTRVAFKKFRYMVEALAEHLPAVTEERREAMHHYQTMMGEIQDAEVLLATLDTFLRKEEMKPEAARRLRAELLRRRQRLIRVYLGAADQLLHFWPLPMFGRASVPASPHLPGRSRESGLAGTLALPGQRLGNAR